MANKKLLVAISTIVFGVVAYLAMRYLLHFEVKKAGFIAGGATAAMLLVDMFLLKEKV